MFGIGFGYFLAVHPANALAGFFAGILFWGVFASEQKKW